MATKEELDEFDVLWPDAASHPHEPPPPPPAAAAAAISSPAVTQRPKQRCCPALARSRPVDVPGAARQLMRRGRDGGDDVEEKNGGDFGGGKIVPPHLLLALAASGRRRPEGEAAAAAARLRSSGRPCKRARDLHHLRDSVLRMTGFIEG